MITTPEFLNNLLASYLETEKEVEEDMDLESEEQKYMNKRFYLIDDTRILYTDGKNTFLYNNGWYKANNYEIKISLAKKITLEEVNKRYG